MCYYDASFLVMLLGSLSLLVVPYRGIECVSTSSSDVAICSDRDAAGDPVSWVSGNPICGFALWKRFASRAGEANTEDYTT